MFSSKKQAVVVAVIGALVLAGSALAAWIIYSGATGSSKGQFGKATNGGAALTIVEGHTRALCDGPGATCDLVTSMTNNAKVAEQILPASGQGAGAVTFVSTPAECATHLSMNPAYAGTNVPANTTTSSDITLAGIVKVDASLPATCSDGGFTVTLNLATAPATS